MHFYFVPYISCHILLIIMYELDRVHAYDQQNKESQRDIQPILVSLFIPVTKYLTKITLQKISSFWLEIKRSWYTMLGKAWKC